MAKTAVADERGRIVIPHDIRETHGERYRVVELEHRVELIPLQEDPIEGLRSAIGDAFEGKSIAAVKHEARESARDDIVDEVSGTGK